MKLRKTKTITLTMLAAIAAAACEETKATTEDIKHCVDENGVVQDESNCATVPEHDADGGPIDPQHPHGGGHFFWYYGGFSSPQSPGTRVTSGTGGGSYTPSVGKSYSPPSISRGGFGATGAGHGAGAGE